MGEGYVNLAMADCDLFNQGFDDLTFDVRGQFRPAVMEGCRFMGNILGGELVDLQQVHLGFEFGKRGGQLIQTFLGGFVELAEALGRDLAFQVKLMHRIMVLQSIHKSNNAMMQFIKNVVLTGFVLFYRIPGKNHRIKINGAITLIALIEWLILSGFLCLYDIFSGKQIVLSHPTFFQKIIVISLFAILWFLNKRIFFVQGVNFEREFDNIEKSRRGLLIISFAALLLSAIGLFVFSRIAYQHFFHSN
jgi:hypothetical protein